MSSQPPGDLPTEDLSPTRFETLIEAAQRSGKDEPLHWQQLHLDRFELQRELGRGGMGLVFLARQTEPVERQVALKLVRRRVLSPATLARFEVERQALAQMQHPAIAQVYDAGTTDEGYPYFAMEYVDGVPLDQFGRDHVLGLEERLALFIRICQGVQHAHQKGIIHRDLKPANILVTWVDGIAVPKIIDFGIAITSSDLPGAAGRRLGTPEYMSPEQFRDQPLSIDTRSDVYALGVMLYELLVDQPPIPRERFQRTGRLSDMAAAFDHVTREPSAMISAPTADRDELARRRGTTTRKLKRRLREDLDAIVLKALAPLPDDRYASAGDLAADVQRSLRHEPVQAVPSSLRYRARKFVRRNALAIGSASAILLALLAGLTAATVGMFEAQRQFILAEQRQHTLEQVTRFQQSMLQDINPQAMGSGMVEEIERQLRTGLARAAQDPAQAEALMSELRVHVDATDLARQTLDLSVLARAVRSVELEFSDQPSTQVELLESILAVYRAIDYPARLPALARRVVALHADQHGPDALQTLTAEVELGWALYLNTELAAAQETLELAVARFDPARPEHHEPLIKARNHLSTVLVDRGSLQAAIDLMEMNAELAREWLGADHPVTIGTISSTGFVHARARNFEQGLAYFEEALAHFRRQLEPDDPRLGRALLNVASSLGQLGRLEQALAIDQEVVAFFHATEGRRSTNSIRAMSNMANNLSGLGQLEAAHRLLVETSGLAAEALGEEHPVTLRTRVNLGSLLARMDQRAAAVDILKPVVQTRLTLLGPDHQETLSAQEILANILIDQGRLDEGLAMIQPVLTRRLSLFGSEHPQTMSARRLLGVALAGQGEHERAVDELSLATAHFHEQAGPDNPLAVSSGLDWYLSLLALGRHAQAASVRADYLSALTVSAEGSVPEQLANLAEELQRIESQPARSAPQP